MKKKYTHKHVAEIPLYRGKLVVLISNDINAIREWLPDIEFERLYAHCITGEHGDVRAVFIILNFDNEFRQMYNGCIAHEAIHAVNAVLEYAGVIADFNNDEPTAYLLEWMVDEVYLACHKAGYKPALNK
jgi:hypothetical protein